MSELTWMDDQRISSIPKNKLDFLQKIFFESKNLTQKEQLPFFIALAGRAKKENISFTQDEINLILDVIKEHSSPEELQKINQTIKMFQAKNNKNT